MMWRPEGWKNPYDNEFDKEEIRWYYRYEEGADAMLEALRKEAKLNPRWYFMYETLKRIGLNPKGTLVFIPDEE